MNEFMISRDGVSLCLARVGEFSDSGTRFITYDSAFEMDGLSAAVRVYDALPSGIALLFAEMAEKWRGWDGVLGGAALEGQFQLEATCDKLGHVALNVILQPSFDGFQVRAVINLDVGDLDQLAAKASSFFHV